MQKQKLAPYYIAFGVLILLVVGIIVANSLHRDDAIQLPEAPSQDASGPVDDSYTDGGITRLEVTPATVQYVIATLARPDAYSRVIRSEVLWSGGSGVTETTVNVRGGVTSLRAALPDGSVRHTLTDGETTCIWYGTGSGWFSGKSADISADDEQGIPTYEDILLLDVSQIALADYRSLTDIDCIYVETAPDEYGYVLRYWVSVDSGLLVAAERLCGEDAVYRMASLMMSDVVDDAAFLLPNGSPFPAGTEE